MSPYLSGGFRFLCGRLFKSTFFLFSTTLFVDLSFFGGLLELDLFRELIQLGDTIPLVGDLLELNSFGEFIQLGEGDDLDLFDLLLLHFLLLLSPLIGELKFSPSSRSVGLLVGVEGSSDMTGAFWTSSLGDD